MVMISYSVTYNTGVDVITLQEAKDHLRITHDYEDTLIQSYIDAAIISAENYTGRYLHLYDVVGKSMTFADAAVLEHGPVNGAVAITYYDSNNTLQTLSTDYYTVMVFNNVPKICYNPIMTLPTLYNRYDRVIVTYQAGYDPIPFPFKQYVRLVVAFLYENRSDTVDKLPRFTNTIIRPYKRWQ